MGHPFKTHPKSMGIQCKVILKRMGNPTKHVSKPMGSRSKTLQEQSGIRPKHWETNGEYYQNMPKPIGTPS